MSQTKPRSMWRVTQYLLHLFYLRHRKGYGIHSPALFELVNRVIFNTSGLRVPGEVRSLHRQILGDHTLIGGMDPGANSRVDQAESRTVRSFVRHSSVSFRYGALLYRITRWFKPETILELGTGLGISTLYLAAGSPGTPLHTIEGNDARADFSSQLFKRCGLSAVQVHVGEMEEILETFPDIAGKRLLAFVDGNHRYEPTLGYIRWVLSRAGEEAVIVMDDIYWSKGMQRAWREIIRWPEVRVSIDLFHIGILLLRKDLAKTTLKMKF